MYLTQAIHRMVQCAPDEVATIDGDRQRTWAETGAAIARFAGALQAIGLAPGDRVAMLARNGAPFLDYIYGTLWAGGAINPVNLRWSAAEVAYSLTNCGTRILLVDPAFAALIPAIRDGALCLDHVLLVGSDEYRAWLDGADPVEDARRSGDDLAAVMYTGGTTGFPKGVMLSHRNILASGLGTIATPGGQPCGAFLVSAPLFHIGSLAIANIAVIGGGPLVFLPMFDAKAALAAIERHRVADLFLVPTMLRMLIGHPDFADHDLSSVRRIVYGASTIDEATLDRLIAALPGAALHQCYGMTELGPCATALSPDDHLGDARHDGRMHSAGRPIATVEVRIVDGEDRELPRGEVGEVVVRGDNVMLGYWDMPEATAAAVRDGWMHTGDLGRMCPRGYVTIVDRLKDMIITGGENVYSAEVEHALSTHPAIAQVAVIAIPDERWGEAVHAVIVLRSGAVADPASFVAHARTRIAGFKIPRSFDVVEALPLSGAGKVLKNVLREQWAAKSLAPA
jgi:acyl-CoA synthetase (AMP-forming)/AMP-acid ligase II